MMINVSNVLFLLLDPIYAVAFSLLLLHTDAHNKNVRQKMNKDTFIMRTRIIEGGEDVPTEILDVSCFLGLFWFRKKKKVHKI